MCCLLTALRYADGSRRHVLLVGLLGLDRAASGEGYGWSRSMLNVDSELALVGHDGGLEEAAAYVAAQPVTVSEHGRRALPITVEVAVATIAEAAPTPDDVLFELFVSCLDDYRDALAAAGQGSRFAWTADSTS